ncbi:MAG: UDP-N-acetylmuramoyl-tripeptide--D-alanyl-D-alanine ligase [Aestuariibacter sp.]
MIEVSLAWVAEQVKGEIRGAEQLALTPENIIIDSVSTDTRTITPNSLFIALVGPNFNAHQFLDTAKQQAVAAIVSEEVETDLICIKVADTREALGLLAAAVKKEVAPKTVGITGSCGKTTVKEMVASVLSQRGSVLATKGNFNNEIGVPLTLLELEREHEFAVVEMGANHLGEIDYTSGLAEPDVATIVNADAAHLEGFGSLLGVARAKSEIFNHIPSSGTAIINADSKFSDYWLGKLHDSETLTFSNKPDNAGADYYPSDVELDMDGCPAFSLNTPQGSVFVHLPLPGIHNVGNALVSAALAQGVGASLENIKMGLENMAQVQGRLNIKKLTNQVRILDDTYNANIASVNAAIDVLATFPGRKIVVLGDMGELGEKARYYHEKVGEYALQKQVDRFYSLGVLSQHASAAFENKGGHFTEVARLIEQMVTDLASEQCDISILVKGSRSARMELVVQAMEESPLGKFERIRERIAC